MNQNFGGHFECGACPPWVAFRCRGCGERTPAAPEAVVELPLDAAQRRELGAAAGAPTAGLVVFLCADCRETIGLNNVNLHSLA